MFYISCQIIMSAFRINKHVHIAQTICFYQQNKFLNNFCLLTRMFRDEKHLQKNDL